MKRLGLVIIVALAGVVLLGLVGGDPRGTRSMARSEAIVLAALVWCALVAVVAWRGARASWWWLAPTGVVSVMGALSGWIAGVEIAGNTQTAVHLQTAPGKVLFLVALTVAGMALPTAGVAAALTRLGRART